MNYFLINKLEGQTPLEALELLRREKGISAEVPMTYAGRLDPMAEGLLLILVGEECKNKNGYLGLDKEYEVEVLLGIGSDTGDILGIVDGAVLIKAQKIVTGNKLSIEIIKEKIKLLVGQRSEKYPNFSSKTVDGIPLFMHTKEGSLSEIKIPEKNIEIYSIDFIDVKEVSKKELIATAIERISKVNGDFRQKEIIESWKKFGEIIASELNESESLSSKVTTIITLKVKSSTGSYMRTLAQKIGELLGTQAIAWKIKRTKIGEYSL